MFLKQYHSQFLSLALGNVKASNSKTEGESKGKEDPDAKYCRYCGNKIPIASNYCPFCGLEQQATPQIFQETSFRRYVTKNIRRIRLTLLITSIVVFVIGFFIGSQTQLSYSEAESIIEGFKELIGVNPTAVDIALNNISLCTIFFTPGIGMLFMIFVSYNTGVVLSAAALLSPSTTPLDIFLTTFLFPWTWMELLAYGLASAQGIMLLLGAFTGRFRQEGKTTLMIAFVCLILLGLGSLIEVNALAYLK